MLELNNESAICFLCTDKKIQTKIRHNKSEKTIFEIKVLLYSDQQVIKKFPRDFQNDGMNKIV